LRIEPFRIEVPDRILDDLRRRLLATRWPDDVVEGDPDPGIPVAAMRDLVEHWLARFDWRAEERALNAMPQFRADVEGFGLHFIHQRGRGPRPLPLVFTHGWPGSFLEARKILPLLADPQSDGGDPEDAFDVVVPSLPGYGFSDRPARAGMNAFRIADLWARLMEGLGHARFGAQGGDWGASVATALGLRHAGRMVGIHLNYVPGSYRPPPDGPDLAAEERSFLEESERWYADQGGYGHVQRTSPRTLAYGLTDSPAGMAAWIVDKFRAWSDCEGDVERRFTKDELVANAMVYWVTQTLHSSSRLYLETKAAPLRFAPGERVRVPCGIVRFAKESPFPPRPWVERGYRVERWTEVPRGGHFAALEEPVRLVEDIRAFFRPLRATEAGR
jgi:pimeloyl-ACP methyl ester carboxylesterase